MPGLPLDVISNQFAYRPTGSTKAALVSLTHTVARRLESCTYVRCLLIDYTKAFDTINHSIRFRKFLSLPVPSQIQRWIFHFFTSRRQAVFSCGEQSQWSPITHSIVQGSGIGPSAYLVYSVDLKTLSKYNSIIKFNLLMIQLYLCLSRPIVLAEAADTTTFCHRLNWPCSKTVFYSAPQCSHCKRCTLYGNSVCLSVRLSVCYTPVLCQNDGSTVQFALSDSKMCLVL